MIFFRRRGGAWSIRCRYPPLPERYAKTPVLLYTDAPELAARLFQPDPGIDDCPPRGDEPCLPEWLVEVFLGREAVYTVPVPDHSPWKFGLLKDRARSSQYVRLIEASRTAKELPDGLVCIAGSGTGFQGFRGRSWQAVDGNIQLSVHFAPARPIERFDSVFMALAAIAVVEAVDAVPGLGGRAGIKWVNDILIDGAKVGGVLAYTQTCGASVTSVILGIGLNVESTPAVAPTPFVPNVASLRDFARDRKTVALGPVLSALLAALWRNYSGLLTGGPGQILQRYRERSLVIGRHALFSSDDPDEVPRLFAKGTVASVGDGLELRLHGRAEPVRHGRMILPVHEPSGGTGVSSSSVSFGVRGAW